ncbi:MAG: M16 family metallopeptidase [Chloroflexota bacterium]
MEQEDVFYSEQLDCGIEVVGQPMAGVESAAVGILVGTGARDEEPAHFGVSHFTEQMLFRGTEHYDARALSESFDSLGVSYDSTAGLEMTLISAVFLGDRMEPTLNLLGDILRYPSFPEPDVESVRTQLLQELLQREDQPAQKVMDVLRQEFFAGSPISHDVLGGEATVSVLTRADLCDYWTQRYTANNMVISVAGNFDWKIFVHHIRRLTEAWSQGRGRMVIDKPTPKTGITVMHRDAAQENIGFAFPCVSVSDPDYYAAALLSLCLGGSSYSRLFREVRDKRGLAYAVQSRFDGLEKTGLMRVYVGTSVDRAHESIEVVLDELRKLETEGIMEDELSTAKTRLKSQLIMRSESTSARMVANLRSWWFEGRLRPLQEIKEEIDTVGVDEIASLVRTMAVMDNLAAVALGPRSEEELFGGVTVQPWRR